MNFKEFLKSDGTKKLLWIIGVLIVVFVIFAGGVAVGYKKALFSSRWGENYYRNFYGERGGTFGMFMDHGRMMNTHGIVGSIIDITSSTLAIKDQNNIEKSVVLDDDAVISRGRETISISDLKIGDTVAVIGAPNEQGQIEARFIRVTPPSLPPPPPKFR